MASMGMVIDLAARRQQRLGQQTGENAAVTRLDSAIAVLDPLLKGTGPHPASTSFAETELLAITGAISMGKLDEAASRAEHLAVRLRDISRHA
jgi:hypothetical protein